MATYVIADIHGQYDRFMDLLKQIALRDSDTLYILGDVLDRGPHPIQTLRKLMEMPNVICLVGNHELMALDSLKFLMQDITEETIQQLSAEKLEGVLVWAERNGGQPTIDEFRALSRKEQREVIEYIEDMLVYEELSIADKDFLLVHAGLGGYYPGKDIEDYSLKELVWDRAEYDIEYFPDTYVVTGHTPTQYIIGNPRPGYIYRSLHHIAIDCGSSKHDGRLAAICLDTGKEFYSPSDKKGEEDE